MSKDLQKLGDAVQSKINQSVTPVQIVAAILLAGHMFRQKLEEKEAPAVAARMVKIAQAIVDASN